MKACKVKGYKTKKGKFVKPHTRKTNIKRPSNSRGVLSGEEYNSRYPQQV